MESSRAAVPVVKLAPVPEAEAKRRRRSVQERREIVEETLVPGASVARVARAHGGCGDSWSESLYVKFSARKGEMAILERVRSGTDPELRLVKSVEDRIVLEVGDRSRPGLSVSTPSPVRAGNWYHLAVVSNNGERILYVNGAVIGRVQLPLIRRVSLSGAAEGSYVGATRDRTSFLNGLVDELAFYNRALTPSEIKSMYELTLRRPCSLARAR